LLLGIVTSVGGDGTKLSQLVNTNAILCWQQVQELITNAFSNTGQPVFELIELQTKAAKENNIYELSFRCRHAGGSSAVDIDNTASVMLRKRCGWSSGSILMSIIWL
jgi:hypothetical protein